MGSAPKPALWLPLSPFSPCTSPLPGPGSPRDTLFSSTDEQFTQNKCTNPSGTAHGFSHVSTPGNHHTPQNERPEPSQHPMGSPCLRAALTAALRAQRNRIGTGSQLAPPPPPCCVWLLLLSARTVPSVHTAAALRARPSSPPCRPIPPRVPLPTTAQHGQHFGDHRLDVQLTPRTFLNTQA